MKGNVPQELRDEIDAQIAQMPGIHPVDWSQFEHLVHVERAEFPTPAAPPSPVYAATSEPPVEIDFEPSHHERDPWKTSSDEPDTVTLVAGVAIIFVTLVVLSAIAGQF